MSEDDFDIENYRETLLENTLTEIEAYAANRELDLRDALTEGIFDAVDQWLAFSSTGDKLTVLEESRNDPDEWRPFVNDNSDWESVVSAMAYSVAKQDAYDALEEEGYLDGYWSPTEKLEEFVRVEV